MTLHYQCSLLKITALISVPLFRVGTGDFTLSLQSIENDSSYTVGVPLFRVGTGDFA